MKMQPLTLICRTILPLLLLAGSDFAARKEKPVFDWKTGVLWASTDPCIQNSGINRESFLIIGDDIVFHVSHGIRIRHKPNVTERGQVKYAMGRGDFYLEDEDGQVFKLNLLKKVLDPDAGKRFQSGERPCR
jgi:hypothetical protein